MIELELEDAVQFKKAIDAISVLIDEAEFVIDQDAFSLKATDPSQISMVDFLLPKSAFKTYDVANTTKIGLDLSYLSSILSRAKSGDNLRMQLDDKGRFNLTFKNGSKRQFSIPLIDISSTNVPSPKIEFDAEMVVSGSALVDGLKDATLISSHITIGVDAEKFFLKAISNKGTLNNEISKKDKGLKDFHVKKECRAMFPLDYMSNMLKGASSDTDVKVFLKANAPIKLSYGIGNAQLTFFLAPRIETE